MIWKGSKERGKRWRIKEEEWEGANKKEETRKREKVEVVGWDGMISHIEVEFISYNMHIVSTLLVNA